MFRKSEEIKARVSEHARGGPGTTYFYDWMSEEESEGHGRLFTRIVLPGGAGIGEHPHEGEYEIYYILKGKASVVEDGKEVIMTEGDFHKCPSGSRHSITNVGEGDVELIAIIQYAGK